MLLARTTRAKRSKEMGGDMESKVNETGTAIDLAPGLQLIEEHDEGSEAVQLEILSAHGSRDIIAAGRVLFRCPRERLAAEPDAYKGRTAHLVDVFGQGVGLAALAYCAARQARIRQRKLLVVSSDQAALVSLLGARSRSAGLATQRVDLAAHYAHQVLEAAATPVNPHVRGLEVRQSAERWLSTGKDWAFFRAVHEGTLTREQYAYALGNVHQFVRHTTRLAARGVGHSPTTEMRSHFIHHLNGEVNHELIIERDLAHLGEDVDYVRTHMPPNGPTQEFMVVQESMIGYYQDPVLLLAAPITAEGVTAHLDEAFIASLTEIVSSWGVEHPERACKFFSSHMHTDGGDDGHWEMSVRFAGRCLTDETKHQFFLCSMRSAMRATTRLYDSLVTDLPPWSIDDQSALKSNAHPAMRA